MRLPIRDVIPSRTRPVISWTAAALSAIVLLVMDPTLLTLGVVSVNVLPLLVLGETVEDQLGHTRYLGVLVVAAGLGGLPAVAASVTGAHISLFPHSRILVFLGFQVAEVPSFFLMGCWMLGLVLLGGPLTWTAVAFAASAGVARLLRQPERGRWEHFDLLD